MGTPTRYPSGVTNVAKTNLFGNCPILAPPKCQVYMADFNVASEIESTDWTYTSSSADAAVSIYSEDGGWGKWATASATAATLYTQHATETWKFETGKKVWFETTLDISDVDNTSWVVGLGLTDTSPLATSSNVAWQCDGDGALDFIVTSGAVATSARAVATLTDSTDFKVGFYYDGASAMSYYYNDVKQGTLDITSTNLPFGDELAVTVGVLNGTTSAIAVLMSDYLCVIKER